MKLKNLFAALAAVFTLGFAVSCDDSTDPTLLSDVQVSSSYVSIAQTGGSSSINVTAAGAWTISGMPDWLTVSPTSGNGNGTVSFSANSTLDGRTAEVALTCGLQTQRINVIQGLATISPATCAEVIAGPDSKNYQVTGICTKIANTQYGNWYLNDGTGEIYIYGTVNASGSYAWSSFNIEVGDEVTVSGPKTTYNGTVELVDAAFIKVNKSLIKCDSTYVGGVASAELPLEGGELTAFLTNKGNGLFVDVPADAQSWLGISSIAGNKVTFKAQPNEGGDRSTTLTFKTTDGKKTYSTEVAILQKGAIVAVTCAEFNAKEDGTAQYKVHGIITSIANTKYGNLYINDGTGEVYVYGITDWNADNFKVGDEVTLQSVKTSYKNAAQMKNAIVLEKVAHEVKTVAELKALPDDKNTYFLVTGKVCHAEEASAKFDLDTYGNFGLQDETGTIYVYGVADGLDGKTKNFAATGVKEGDTITILAYKTSYKDTIELVGKFIKKEAAK